MSGGLGDKKGAHGPICISTLPWAPASLSINRPAGAACGHDDKLTHRCRGLPADRLIPRCTNFQGVNVTIPLCHAGLGPEKQTEEAVHSYGGWSGQGLPQGAGGFVWILQRCSEIQTCKRSSLF